MLNPRRRFGMAAPLASFPFASFTLAGFLGLAVPKAAPGDSPRPIPRPNLVLVIADDLGYGETGMMGANDVPTPAIDALAAAGVRCTSGYVTSSYCSGSRAGILTGKFQSRFGYDMNPTGKRNLHPEAGLPESETTFIRRLADAGYRTGLFGKWHLGTVATRVPTRRGFDRFYGFLHEGHFYVPGSAGEPNSPGVLTMIRDASLPAGLFRRERDLIRGNYAKLNEPRYDADNPVLAGRSGAEPERIVDHDYLTDAITDRAVRFIRNAAGRSSVPPDPLLASGFAPTTNPENANPAPFCAVVAYNAVHSPMQGLHTDLARLGHIEDDQRRIFAAMLVAMDRGIGAITKTLAELDLTRKTLVVFVSDNGGPTAELTSSNHPLRGGKGTLYEGGVRVPMVWSMPGTLPAGATEDRVVVSVDIAATALRAAGLAVPESMDGRDFLGWLGRNDDAPLHRDVYWRMSHGRTAYRWDDWKIVRPNRGRPFELYDLATDQAEQKNLADLKPGVLKNTLRQWQLIDSSMAPPIHLPQ